MSSPDRDATTTLRWSSPSAEQRREQSMWYTSNFSRDSCGHRFHRVPVGMVIARPFDQVAVVRSTFGVRRFERKPRPRSTRRG